MPADNQSRLRWVQDVLREIGFAKEFNSLQTARTVLALADDTLRKGLKSRKERLSDGAVLHDILEFVRRDLGKAVKENTRESYRKLSLKPLRHSKLVTRHQASPNDPKTYYKLNTALAEVIRNGPGSNWKRKVKRLADLDQEKERVLQAGGELRLKLQSGRLIRLSAGEHNRLALMFAEHFPKQHRPAAQVAFIGDQANRRGYQDRDLLREVNLTLDVIQTVPDGILLDTAGKVLVVAEFVTSVGAISQSRKEDLERKLSPARELGYSIKYLTVFPDRKTFARFAAQIAYGTFVWIAEEPEHLIRYNGP